MNCYYGLAKRLIKSCFPQVIPVPQLEPLDAKNIIKHRSYQVACEEATKYPCERWKEVYETHMNVSFKPKPISDEAAVTCIRCAKTKEKEKALLLKLLLSQTDTDESYDSDDSEFGVPTYPVRKSALFAGSDNEDTVKQQVKSIIAQWVITSKKWYAARTIQAVVRGRLVRSGAHELFNFTDFYNAYYTRKAAEARQCWWVTTYTLSRTAAAMTTLWNVEKRAATLIQAAERGRVVRLTACYAAFDKVAAERAERRRTAKKTKQTWKAANDPTTWYRI
jgi:hypothetical protein